MQGAPGDEGAREPVPLLAPREGVPPVVASAPALAATVEAFGAGDGPVAIDAERASGYRYTQRAYLVQLRRQGAGTALIDPIACPDLHELSAAIRDAEWVIHAASQDLGCLAGVGLVPDRLFDTELAGRLAGYERVGLGPLVENLLGYRLEKGHSAADWSTRPLPEPWLRYAALDVELLLDLREVLAGELARQGKLEWARQEFAALVAAAPPPPRVDPWRRTSGIHRARSRRQLARVRALWQARDELARERDIAPGRIIPDSAITALALDTSGNGGDPMAVAGYTGRGARRYARVFAAALARAQRLAERDLPPTSLPTDGPPAHNRWADRDPVAAARLAGCRAVLAELAEGHRLPVENLLAPDAVRRLAWQPPDPADAERVAGVLRAAGARPWQVELTADALAGALAEAAKG